MRVSFDDFELDRDECQLYRAGLPVPIEPRALALLLYFVANPARLITRDELVTNVWQAQVLSEGVLASTVAKLRKAIAQDSERREPLETVRGRGYRWHAQAQPQPVEGVSVAHDPFIARAAQLLQLTEAAGRAAAGSGQLIFVSGDAGMGKTRLLHELEQRALALGYRVFRGAGYDAQAVPAYWPWVEILRAAHQQLTAAGFCAHLPTSCAGLQQLVPELCGVAGAGTPATAQRFALMNDLSCFIESCSRELPLLIVIDDLHWADAGTIELLAYCARVLTRARVLLVAAAREHELAGQDAGRAAGAEARSLLQDALHHLQRTASSVALGPLTRAEVSELATALDAQHACDVTFVTSLFERTQGNPLFVRETLRLLRHAGACSAADVELPPLVRGVIDRRVRILPGQTQHVLAAASSVGVSFDAFVLAEVLDLSLAAVVQALEPALAQRVLERNERQYAFSHALLRDAVYASLSSAEQGLLHGRVAHALVKRRAASDARQLAAIAHHFLLAIPSELDGSVLHGRAAAAATRASSGFQAAAAMIERVLQKHEQESSDLLVRCELILELAEDLSYAGEMRAAWQALRRGSELALQLGAAEMIARFALALSPWLDFGGGDENYTYMLQARALEAVHDQPELRARLLAKRAPIETDRSLQYRLALLDEATALALGPARAGALEPCADPIMAVAERSPELARDLAFAHVRLRSPQLPAAERDLARYRVLDAADGGGGGDFLRVHRAFAVELTGYAHALSSVQLEAAEAALARGRMIERDAHMSSLSFVLDMVDAGRALAAGQLEALEGCLVRLREASAGGGAFGLTWLRYAALLNYERGNLGVLRDVPLEHLPQIAELPKHERLQGELFRAWLYVKAGLEARAQHKLTEIAPSLIERMPQRSDDIAPLCMLAEVYTQLGDRAGAERLFSQLAPYAERNAVGPTFDSLGAVTHFMGLLAALLGREPVARQYFQHALCLNGHLHMPLQLARTQAELTRLG